MSVKSVMDYGFWNFEDKQPHAVWEIVLANTILRMERYGSWCGWDEIKLKENGIEVYRITLDPQYKDEKDLGRRNEFFSGIVARTYVGNQFSFLEYVTIVSEVGVIPEPSVFWDYGLEPTIEKLYRKKLTEILCAR